MVPQAPGYGSPVSTLRVATFNIRHGLGTGGTLDLARTARVIEAIDPDIISLQEVDRNLERSGNEDQVDVLAAMTGLRFHFASALVPGAGAYGIALGLKKEAGEAEGVVESFPLPRVDDEESRVAQSTRFRGISFVATHLSVRPGPRDVQMMDLAKRLRYLTSPAVVFGDLNASRRGLGHLVAAGLRPGPKHATMSFWRQVDHILLPPGLGDVRFRTIPTDASDHDPLIADLEVPGARP